MSSAALCFLLGKTLNKGRALRRKSLKGKNQQVPQTAPMLCPVSAEIFQLFQSDPRLKPKTLQKMRTGSFCRHCSNKLLIQPLPKSHPLAATAIPKLFCRNSVLNRTVFSYIHKATFI